MYEIIFYRRNDGTEPVKKLLEELRSKSSTNKDAHIQYNKIMTQIRALQTFGTRVGAPVVKHLDGDLWELRPLSHRILFFYWKNNNFVLLHHFIKKSQKTPKREIEAAKSNMRDFLEQINET